MAKKKKNNSKHSSSAPKKMTKVATANEGLLSSGALIPDALTSDASAPDAPISDTQVLDAPALDSSVTGEAISVFSVPDSPSSEDSVADVPAIDASVPDAGAESFIESLPAANTDVVEGKHHKNKKGKKNGSPKQSDFEAASSAIDETAKIAEVSTDSELSASEPVAEPSREASAIEPADGVSDEHSDAIIAETLDEGKPRKNKKRRKKESPKQSDSEASVQGNVDSEPMAEPMSERAPVVEDASEVAATNDIAVSNDATDEPSNVAEEVPVIESSADEPVAEPPEEANAPESNEASSAVESSEEATADEHIEEAAAAELPDEVSAVESVEKTSVNESAEETPAAETAEVQIEEKQAGVEPDATGAEDAESENVATLPEKYNMPNLDEEIVERMRDRRRNRKKNFQENLLNIKNTLKNFYDSKDKLDDDTPAEPKKEIEGDGFVFVQTEPTAQAADQADEKSETEAVAPFKDNAPATMQAKKQEKKPRNPMPVDTLVSASQKPDAAPSDESVPTKAEEALNADSGAVDSQEESRDDEVAASPKPAASEDSESAIVEKTVEQEPDDAEELSDDALLANAAEAEEEREPVDSQNGRDADVAASATQANVSAEVIQSSDDNQEKEEPAVFDANSFEYDEFDDDGNIIWKTVDDYSKVFSEEFYSKYDGAEYLRSLKAKARSVRSDVEAKSAKSESTAYGIKYIQARDLLVDYVYKGLEKKPLKIYDYVKPEYPLAICTEKITFKQFFKDLYMNFKSHEYASQSVFKKIIYGTTYPKKIIKMRDVKYKNSLIWLIVSLIAPIFGFVAFALTSRSMPIFAKRCLKGAALGTLVIAACFAAFAFGYTGILPRVFL